ncbi:MAG: zinc-binding dehydrogenase [Chloroflexi bacterium]|nr:zinc-binding dehydrogenase [Chloroflexota bacterium]
MKAALLERVGRMAMVDVERPVIAQPDEILIRTKTVGVCGSEIHAFHGTHPYRKAPVILGHEAAGEVFAVGKAVKKFQVGDRVIVDPQWTCGKCAYCLRGDINVCPSKRVLGTANWQGAFGEYFVAPEEAVFHLPSNLSYAQGSLIEPLTVGVHVARRANLQAGESVAILGAGAIGGLLSGVCHTQGAQTVIAADIKQHCLDAARERLGATHDFLLPDVQVAEKIKRVSDGGVDVVFITADDGSLVNLGIEIAKRRGRIVLVALLTEAPLQFVAYPIISKELQIVGSLMSSPADVEKAIDLAASNQVDVEAIATHRLPIEQAQRGMELALTKDDQAIKVILGF